MATLALFLTIGGTAAAAIVITGANIKNNSLLSRDVKRESLEDRDLTRAAKAALVGTQGDKGATGSKGSKGITGVNGSQGPRGSAAYMTSAYSFLSTGVMTQRGTQTPNNGENNTGHDWDDPNYANDSINVVGGPYPNLRTLGNYLNVSLGNTMQPMTALTGMPGAHANATKSPDTLLRLTFSDGYLNAQASLTLLHRADGEDLTSHSSGAVRNGRAVCALFYGTSADPNALTQMAGIPAYVSSDMSHELVQVSLNGNAAGMAAGTQYNVTVKCRDADFTGNTQWQLVSGNLTTFISR